MDIRLRVPGFPDPQIVSDSSPALKMWLDIGGVPIPPPWTPTFEPQHVVTNTRFGPQLLNPDYFADQPTAEEIMRRLGASSIVQVPYQASSPVDATTAKEWWIVFPDGLAHNAGLLAVQFLRHPEDREPGVALRNCQSFIAAARAAGQKLPQAAS